MRTLARRRSTAAHPASRSFFHPRLRAALLLAGTLPALLLSASPAGAIVEKVGSAEVGLQPRNAEFFLDGQLGGTFANAAGNPVVHSNSTYAVFWDPTNSYHGDWQHLVDRFLENVGGSSGELASVFAVEGQYTDRTNQPLTNHSVFKGAYTDTDIYPASGCTDPHPLLLADQLLINKVHVPVCLTDEQVRVELGRFLSSHGLPTGMSTIYYVLTPPGVAMCLDGGGATGHCSSYTGNAGETSYENSFCSYHGAINSGGLATGDAKTVLYAAIPWMAGGLGNPHLLPGDQRPAYECQDGGFDPSTEPAEESEHPRERTVKEKEEFEEATKEEKEEKEAEEIREGPRQQEPNQVPCPSIDGGCDTGLADLIIGQIAIEQQNVVTNPLLNAWQGTARYEVTDECRNFFAPTLGGDSVGKKGSLAGTLFNQELGGYPYYLQTAYDLAAFTFSFPGVPCVPGVILEPRFTNPNPVNTGELVGFNGMESAITLNAGVKYPTSGEPSPTYPTYTWDFGDGSPTVTGLAPGAPSQNSPETSLCETPWTAPCAAASFHSYQYGGTYEVTLTAKDVGGNIARFSRIVTVDGPAPPAPPAPPSPPGPDTSTTSGGSSSAANGTVGKSGGAAGGAGTPKVVATQAVGSHSLSSALRSGLVVRYSVSAQATGRFEVLLASSVAKKIGLRGPVATGLAKGTPPQVVIAKAILVATKGGHSSYKIKFGKVAAAKLRKLHKVTLMIRMVVHNASSPVATTVLSTANLSR